MHRPNHILFKALEKCRNGTLAVTTPDGHVLTFGNGSGPHAGWQIKNWAALDEILAQGENGFAETYIRSEWSSADLPQLIIFMLMNNEALESYFHGRPLHWLWHKLLHTLSPNSLRRSRRNVQVHYDLGNQFYALWLDKSMTYSCAYFGDESGRTLEEAQQAKYQRILDKLSATPGQHILEIGCGWGGFAEAAARRGLRVTGITLSDEQAAYAQQRMKENGLDQLVEIRLEDYRKLSGCFDHIVSIGMFEHVGQAFWPAYFSALKNLLKTGGTAMIQTITLDDDLFEKLGNTTGFIEKYIFPGGMLPSKTRFSQNAERAGLQCRELFAFGGDYAKTLQEWSARFEQHLPQVRALGYDDRFIAIWRFYLASCIAAFMVRRTDVMQAELTSTK